MKNPLLRLEKIQKSFTNPEEQKLLVLDNINFQLEAEDRSNNPVSQFVGQDSFRVDNIPPADFTTGLVSTHGLNPVQGWITGITDSIGVQVPIQTFNVPDPSDSTNSDDVDTTLHEGGSVQIQFYNLSNIY